MNTAKKAFLGIIAAIGCIAGTAYGLTAPAAVSVTAPAAPVVLTASVHHVKVVQQVRVSHRIYTVVAGDTLSGIAASHGISLSAIEAANPQIANFDLIYAGDKVNLTRGAHAAPARAAPAPSSSGGSAGGGTIGAIPGMSQSFAQCIAMAESSSTYGSATVGNPAAGGNAYGIIPASGYNVSGMSIAEQNQIAGQLYAAYGTSPWAPYDGC